MPVPKLKNIPSRLVISWGILLSLVILLLGLVLTFMAWQVTGNLVKDQQIAEFIKNTYGFQESVKKEMAGYMQALYGVKGLFSASEVVERDEFSIYFNAIDINKIYPGVYTFAYVSRVSDEDAPEFLQNLNQDLVAKEGRSIDRKNFEINNNGEHYFLNYIYKNPAVELPLSFGFDLGTNSERKGVLGTARDTGDPVASSPVSLLGPKEQGFIITIPIYKNGVKTESVEDKRQALVGFVNVAFSYDYLFEELIKPYVNEKMELQAYDNNQLIFDSIPLEKNIADGSIHQAEGEILVAGRKWDLKFYIPESYKGNKLQSNLPGVVLLVGSALSLLLSGLIFSLISTGYKAKQIAINMTDELIKSKEGLSDAQRIAHLGNWNWDIPTNTLQWSDEIYRIFGRRPQEFGATYDEFINYIHPDDRNKVHQAVDLAVYQKKPYSIEHRIVRPTGETRTVFELGEVIYDNEGKPLRMTGTVLDTTELSEKNNELEKLNKLMVGREIKMVEMKKVIEELEKNEK